VKDKVRTTRKEPKSSPRRESGPVLFSALYVSTNFVLRLRVTFPRYDQASAPLPPSQMSSQNPFPLIPKTSKNFTLLPPHTWISRCMHWKSILIVYMDTQTFGSPSPMENYHGSRSRKHPKLRFMDQCNTTINEIYISEEKWKEFASGDLLGTQCYENNRTQTCWAVKAKARTQFNYRQFCINIYSSADDLTPSGT